MKLKLLPLLFVLSVLMISCSSSYKTTQTPDDLYYSPEPVLQEQKADDKQDETSWNSYNNNNYYDDYYLRHKVRNRCYWSTIDDYGYWHDTRYNHCPSNWNSYNNNYGWGGYNNYGYNSCYNGFNNYYYGWNSYYAGWYGSYWYGSYWYPYYGNGGGFYTWHNPYQSFAGSHYNIRNIKPASTNNTLTYYNQNYNNTNYSYNPQTGTYQGTNTNNNTKVRTTRSSSNGDSWTNPIRVFNSSSAPSSNAGGNSGGFNSKGSSATKPRG